MKVIIIQTCSEIIIKKWELFKKSNIKNFLLLFS